MRAAALVVVGLLGCPRSDFSNLDGGTLGKTGDNRTLVASIRVTVNRDVDILFLLDDSPSMLDKQTNLKAHFPTFINVLNTIEGGLPNVHIGVVSSDLGTKGSRDSQGGPGIGSGSGSCSGNGKSGVLQTNGSTLINRSALPDHDSGMGSHIHDVMGGR